MPERLQNATFENFDLKLNRTMLAAFLRCKDVAEGRAWSALLSGPPGLGKSHLAVAALQASVHPKPGVYWPLPSLLRFLRHLTVSDDGPHLAEDYALKPYQEGKHLLVLDDVGAEKGTEWAQQTLYSILNSRYDASLPTIVTTNNPDAIDDRVLSRYFEGTVVCRGADIRRKQGATA